MTLLAAIQMASGTDRDNNLKEADRLITSAAEKGAKLVILPENFALMGRRETDKLAIRETPGQGPIQEFLASRAKQHGIWLVGGTMPMAVDNPGKVRAASLLYNDQGQLAARYDKIHLFDVQVPNSQDSYRESDGIEPGSTPVVVDTPFGRLGLAVCYDLRFPELFRRMQQRGMDILSLPAAFTTATGQAHWELLLRARAVENLCYVIAPDQGGLHPNNKPAYEHSMIIDPWGKVVAQKDHGAGVVLAEMDPNMLNQVRTRFPALQHRIM